MSKLWSRRVTVVPLASWNLTYLPKWTSYVFLNCGRASRLVPEQRCLPERTPRAYHGVVHEPVVREERGGPSRADGARRRLVQLHRRPGAVSPTLPPPVVVRPIQVLLLVQAHSRARGAAQDVVHLSVVCVALEHDPLAAFKRLRPHAVRELISLFVRQRAEDGHARQLLLVPSVQHPPLHARDRLQERKHERVVRRGAEEVRARAAVERPRPLAQHDESKRLDRVSMQVRLQVDVRAARVDRLHHRDRGRGG